VSSLPYTLYASFGIHQRLYLHKMAKRYHTHAQKVTHTDSLMLTACWVITDEVASSCKLVLCLVMTSYTELVNERCAQLYLHYSLLSQTDIKFWKLSSKNDDLYVILDYRTAAKNKKKLKYLEIPAGNFGVDRFPISRAFSIGNFRWPWFRDLG